MLSVRTRAKIFASLLVASIAWPASLLAQTPMQRTRLSPLESNSSSRCNTCNTCVHANAWPHDSIIDQQLKKLEALHQKRTMLPQHQAYDSPMEGSYFFRPYGPSHLEPQRSFMSDRTNPYDNRVFQSLYGDDAAPK